MRLTKNTCMRAKCTISQKRICNVSVGKYEEYVFYVSAIAYVILYVTV